MVKKQQMRWSQKGAHLTAQYLVGAHALGTGSLGHGFAFVQILQNIPTDGRVCINDAADYFQLLALRMIKNVGHQRHLFLPFFAHFVTGSFIVFVVIFVVWQFPIYYKKKKKTTAKCAFLCITSSYSLGWTLNNGTLVFTEIFLYHRYNKKKVYMDKLSAPKELEKNHIISIDQPQLDGRLSDKAISLNLERCPQCKKILFKKKNGKLFCPNECDDHRRRLAYNTVVDPKKDRRFHTTIHPWDNVR